MTFKYTLVTLVNIMNSNLLGTVGGPGQNLRTLTLLQVVMRPESVSWQVQRGTRVALLCGATAALTDQQLTKMLGDKMWQDRL